VLARRCHPFGRFESIFHFDGEGLAVADLALTLPNSFLFSFLATGILYRPVRNRREQGFLSAPGSPVEARRRGLLVQEKRVFWVVEHLECGRRPHEHKLRWYAIPPSSRRLRPALRSRITSTIHPARPPHFLPSDAAFSASILAFFFFFFRSLLQARLPHPLSARPSLPTAACANSPAALHDTDIR
jgi:hypothetical protein